MDLVLSNQDGIFQEVKTEGRLGHSDHEMVMVTAEMTLEKNTGNSLYRNFNTADYGEMRKSLDIDWEEALRGKNVEETWKELRTKIEDALAKHAPWRKRRQKEGPKWMNNDIRRMIQKKRRAWDNWKRTRGMKEKKEYEELEKGTKRMIRNRKNEVERKIAREAKSNPKNFYSYVNGAQQSRSKIGPLKDKDGVVISDPQQQSNLLNDFYSSVFYTDR